MYPDGLCKLDDHTWSKCIEFEDVNYQLAKPDDQTAIFLNQASGDRKILCERLNISNQQAAHISNAGPGEGLIFFGNVILPFVDDFPKDNELYSIMTTKLGETGKGENEHE